MMVLLEIEEQIKPLTKPDKVQLLHFLVDELAEDGMQEHVEDMNDVEIFDKRMNEPDRPFSEYLAERRQQYCSSHFHQTSPK
ncbi:MAG: hypothetical protein GY801_18500 [bacterium]|nr:hypothetical protein [bacterium]